MALSAAFNGAVPVRKRGSSPNSMGTNRYRIANGYADSIFRGDLVKISAGYIQPVSVTADRPIGVFQGSEYVDPNSKQPTWLNYWPSGTSSADATPYAHVMDDPSAIYVMQCDSTVSIGDVESHNFFVTIATGSTFTGQSIWAVQASARTSVPSAVRIVGLWDVPGNEWGDANTKVLVRLPAHIDVFASIAT